MLCRCLKPSYKKTSQGYKHFKRDAVWNWKKCPDNWEEIETETNEPDEGLEGSDGNDSKEFDFENASREEMYEKEKDWTKDMLITYCKEKYGDELDKRKSKPELIDLFMHLKASR